MADQLHDPYIRRARVRRVVDGDTIDVDIDLGFHATVSHRLRLAGVDTPELRNKTTKVEALAAKQYVEDWVESEDDWPLIIRTEKTGKWNRWIAQIWRTGDPVDLSTALINEGLGVEY